MKMTLKMAGVLLTGALILGGFNARADAGTGATVQIHSQADFEAPLAAHGTWGDVGSYGRCWRPNGVAADWRPYGDGQWTWTDAGWYWDSQEPWAWACYHYGTWFNNPGKGWVWVPGTEWAPARVNWRTGGGYVGWAPSAPPGVAIAPANFAFVGVDRFNDRIRPGMLLVNEPAIIQNSTPIAVTKSESRDIGGSRQNVAVNAGPGIDEIQKSTGRRITPIPVGTAGRLTVSPGGGTPARGQTPVASPALERGAVEIPVPQGAISGRSAFPESASQTGVPIQPGGHPENAVPVPRGGSTPVPQPPGKVAPNTPVPNPPTKPVVPVPPPQKPPPKP